MAEMANPTLAMQVRPVGPLQTNPFEVVTNFANAQKSMVEAQMARASLAARAKAGQIIASSPDLDSAIGAMQKDPLVSGYLPDVMSTLQGISGAITTQKGAQQEQAKSGLDLLFKVIGASGGDPSTLKSNANAALETLSPSAKASVGKSFNAIVKGLVSGLDDPNVPDEQKQQILAKRIAGIGIAGGLSTDVIRAQHGSVAPSVSLQPVGEGGAQVPVMAGSKDLTSAPGAEIVGQPQAPVQGQTTQQLATQQGVGGAAGDVAKEMSDTAAVLPTEIRRISVLRNALASVTTGGGATNRTQLGETMQALRNIGFTGITEEMIDKVANGDLAASQQVTAQISQMAIAGLRDAQRGLGKGTAQELNTTMDQTDLDKDPKMLMTLLDQVDYNLQMQKDKVGKYVDFRAALKRGDKDMPDASAFNEWYNLHHADDFTAQYEKSHPKPIATKAEKEKAKPKTKLTPEEEDKILNDAFGQ